MSQRTAAKSEKPLVHGSVNEALFDRRPLVIADAFRLTATGAVAIGKPTIEQWSTAFEFAAAAQSSSAYWVGDLLNYAESRADWREKLSQAQAVTGLAEGSLHNLAYISRKVTGRARQVSPSLSHSQEVAKLRDPEEQVQWLEQARTEGWNAIELRDKILDSRRRKVLEGQAFLEGMYRVIYADPPYLQDDRGGITPSDNSGRAERHYRGMTIDELCKLPVAAHTHRNAVLFLWVPAPMLATCWPVIEAWGFEYKTGLVWDKVLHNFGHYVSVRHDHLLICTRGSCTPDHPTKMPDSVQTIRRSDVDSEKPEEFRRLITSLYEGPYLELFARKQTKNWSCFGSDARLWASEAAVTA